MDLDTLVHEVGQELLRHKLMLATAESCTGGGVAQAITSVPGSSQWFERGTVTYSDSSKQELLGVGEGLLARYGAVSEATARAMANGALVRSRAQVSLAITGIAGPDGGSETKPVGTVWIAWAGIERETVAQLFQLPGDREHVRRQAVALALLGLLRFLHE